MASLELALVFGILLAFVHYYSGRMQDFYLRHKRVLSTFSSGVVISYLVLDLLPAIYQVQGRLSKVTFVSLLSGIAIFFLIDSHISRHKMRYKLKSEIREEHTVSLFVYHVLIGIAFIAFSESFLDLLLFFIPLALFSAFNSISLKEVYEIEREPELVRVILSASTLIGALLATIVPVSRLLYFPLLGFIGGSVFYITLNDVIREPERKIRYFFWGMAAYTAIIGFTWWVF